MNARPAAALLALLLAAAPFVAAMQPPPPPGAAVGPGTNAAAPDSLGYLNLDFESRGLAREWYTGSEGYDVAIDTTVAYSGRQSLRMRYLRPGRIGIATLTLPGAALAGHRLRIAASVRTEMVVTGWAGIWCRVDGADRLLSFVTSRERASRGTTPWRRQEIEVAVDSTAVEVHLGARLTGDGAAWFDRFDLTLDGVPYREPPEPPRHDPGPGEIDWIRAHAIPVGDDDPARDCSDLLPVLRLIGNARVVGLGEGTHGTREFSRMKHRLFRCMVEDLGFTLFGMESSVNRTERLNHYVLTGEGDPADLLRSMGFVTWNAQEVLDLLRWMRQYNTTARVPVRFVGFDMMDMSVPVDSLLRFARDLHPEALPAVGESLRIVALVNETDRIGTGGTAAAFLRGEPLAGKKLRLHGWLRTEGIEDGEAALWIRADTDSGRPVIAGMEGAGPRGTTPWTRREVELVVPRGARRVVFGAALRGDGSAWFDSLGLDVDGRPTRSGTFYDFGFEDARPLGGLRLSGTGYRAAADTAGARFGRRSLRLWLDPGGLVADRAARWERAIGAARGVLARLAADSAALVARLPEEEVARALQNARLVVQGCEAGRNPPLRDRAMAENVAWLMDRAPAGSRIALWAHNAHVSRRAGAMGSYLADRFGSGYWNLALAFHEGSYAAADGRGVRAYEAAPSPPGSVEWAFHRSGIPRLVLDLHAASAADTASAWLTGTPEFRSIGLLPVNQGFHRTRVAHDFDAVLFLDRASAARPVSREGSP